MQEEHRGRLSARARGPVRLVLASVAVVSLSHASTLNEQSQGMPAWVTPLESDGSPHEGAIGTNEDQDYFRLEMTELARAVVCTTGPSTPSARSLIRRADRSRRMTTGQGVPVRELSCFSGLVSPRELPRAGVLVVGFSWHLHPVRRGDAMRQIVMVSA